MGTEPPSPQSSSIQSSSIQSSSIQSSSIQSISVHAYHGWGFDASCWDGWHQQFRQQFRQRFGHHSCRFQAFDRGYFHQPQLPVLIPNAHTYQITLVHSYGLHLCPKEHLNQTNLLVIFASFAEFHPQSPRFRKRSQYILQQMISQFAIDPHAVLNRFKTNCYDPVIWHEPDPNLLNPESLNYDRLLADLNALNTAAIDLTPLHTIPNVIILHGSNDRIVSPDIGRNLAQHLPPTSQFIEIENAGHALPFTHLDPCWDILQSVISEIDLQTDIRTDIKATLHP